MQLNDSFRCNTVNIDFFWIFSDGLSAQATAVCKYNIDLERLSTNHVTYHQKPFSRDLPTIYFLFENTSKSLLLLIKVFLVRVLTYLQINLIQLC